jgi:hypothetical protein
MKRGEQLRHNMEDSVMKTALKLLALIPALGLMSSTAAIARDSSAKLLTRCTGGAQEFVNGLTQNVAVAVGFAAAPQPIPFTTVVGGPAVGGDLFVVTFSGEADNTGGFFWTAQAEASTDNGATWFPIDPVGPNTFHQGNLEETHTMTWCRRINDDNVLFRIVWDKVGAGNAIVDDFTTIVERSD